MEEQEKQGGKAWTEIQIAPGMGHPPKENG